MIQRLRACFKSGLLPPDFVEKILKSSSTAVYTPVLKSFLPRQKSKSLLLKQALRYFLVTLLVISSGQSRSEPKSETTLPQAYQSALENALALQIQTSKMIQLDEKLQQAKGALLPTVNLTATYFRQESVAIVGGASSSTQSQLDPNQIASRVTGIQPLFRGLRDRAAIKQSILNLSAQEKTLQHTRQTVFSNVSLAFYSVLSAEQDLKNLANLAGLMERRITELKQKSQIGRTRKGELLAAQTQLSILRGQEEAAQLVLNQARDQFALVSGLKADTRLADESSSFPTRLMDLQYYLNLVENRSDIQSLKHQRDGVEEAIAISKGGHLPSVDALANIYLKRPGTLENVHWDVGVSLSLPIFQGGIVQSQIRESSQKVKEAELGLEQARQEAIRQIQGFHESVKRGLTQLKSYEEAIRISEENYETQTKDYRLGIATNLDVIQSLNTFQEAKRVMDRIRFQTKGNYILLEAAVGKIPQTK